ncbi:MAG: hypothetical protein R3B54_10870 [Bdellovibrionota bacterium]
MEPILHAIEGPFTYVVIAEVSIICALFLALLYLIVKRTLQPIEGYAGVAVMPQPAIAVPAAEVSDVEEKVEANAGSKGAAEPTEEELLQKGYPDVATYYAFKDKIKYLESKLLEYEILQEEIGTLSGLKMENEHLKNKLDSMEKQISEAKAAVETAAKEITPTEPEPKVEPSPAEVPANAEKKAHSSEAELVRESDETDQRQQKPSDPMELLTAAVASKKELAASPTPLEKKPVEAEKPAPKVQEKKTEAKIDAKVEVKAETKKESKPEPAKEAKTESKAAPKKSASESSPKPKTKTKGKATTPKKTEKEPDAKMDSGTAVESTDLEPTLPGKSEAEADQGEPTALGGQSDKVEAAAEPNDDPPSIADQTDGSPVIDGILDQLDQLAQEKKAEKDKKKTG